MPCFGDSEGQVLRQGDSGGVGEHWGEGDRQGHRVTVAMESTGHRMNI